MTRSNDVKRPLVSVIIPVYNSAKTLHRCIESATRQSYRNFEIIIVDNDSIDKTRDIAIKWSKILGEDRCRYYNIKKRYQDGRSYSRNYAVKMSRGGRIYLHDSDQYLTPKVLEECITIVSQGFDAVAVPVKFIIPKTYIARSIFYSIILLIPKIEDYPNFIKKEDWLLLGGLDERIGFMEDFDFYLRFKSANLTMGRINAVSLHDQSFTLTSMIRKTINSVKFTRVLKNRLSIPGVKDVINFNLLKMVWVMLNNYIIYMPGIILVILTRLIIRTSLEILLPLSLYIEIEK